METNKKVLTEYGFEKIEAEVYSSLVKNGDTPIAKLMGDTELSRASIYDALEELEEKNLINHRKEGRRAFYSPKHPDKLYEFIENKKRETEMLNSQMETVIGQFKGAFNLAKNKPGVRFFEGKEGLKKALEDTLTTQETIRAIVNIEALNKYANKQNARYLEKRINQGVKKKTLKLKESEEYIQNRKDYYPKIDTEKYKKLTKTKVLPKDTNPFRTTVQIYDNKVAYLNIRKENIISIIIEDKDIYKLNKNIFDLLWNLEDYKNLPKKPNSGTRNKMLKDLS